MKRTRTESIEITEQFSLLEASNMIKQEQIVQLEKLLSRFNNVDVERYRFLTRDLRIAQNALRDNDKEYKYANDRAA